MPEWTHERILPIALPALKPPVEVSMEMWSVQIREASGTKLTIPAYLPAQDSMADVVCGGRSLIALTEADRPWARILDALLAIPGKPLPRIGPAVIRMRSARISRKIDVFWSDKWGDRKLNEQLIEETNRACVECSERLEKQLVMQVGMEFPDAAFKVRITRLLGESDQDHKEISRPLGYAMFREKLLKTACVNPSLASLELLRAQKSKNAARRLFAKCLMVDATDLLHACYVRGMTEIRKHLVDTGALADAPARGLYRFLHEQHEYLDGIVPILHPISELMLQSDPFLFAAYRRFEAISPSIEIQASFYGSIEAAASAYRGRVMQNRDRDREKKGQNR
ncbi:MAG: hypothetical protein HS116_05910 [Planctomycetes bacterium]|nr:hypothetical protein [Planctomycetota bacterium]